MGIVGDVAGVQDLRGSLRRAADELSDLSGVDREVGQLVLAHVDPPRLTGALASTVRAEPDAGGVTVAAGSPDVPYAGVIHNGWPAHNIRARPYLTDALDKQEAAIADKYADHADHAMAQVKGV
jgi:hypothetical protein